MPAAGITANKTVSSFISLLRARLRHRPSRRMGSRAFASSKLPTKEVFRQSSTRLAIYPGQDSHFRVSETRSLAKGGDEMDLQRQDIGSHVQDKES